MNRSTLAQPLLALLALAVLLVVLVVWMWGQHAGLALGAAVAFNLVLGALPHTIRRVP